MKSTLPFRPVPRSILWHYASGRIPMWTRGVGSPVGWITYSHRGVQMLDRFELGRKQKQEVFNKRFDFRINTAFGQVIRACAEDRAGQTWITPDVIAGYDRLHHLGFAHSFEIWRDGQLVGGFYGLQIGGYISGESMFHRAPSAGKAAQIRSWLHLRQRGFTFIDTNGVSPHMAKFGAEWIPQWRFMELLKTALRQPLSVTDDRPAPSLPLSIRAALPAADLFRKIARRLGLPVDLAVTRQQDAEDAQPPEPKPAEASPVSSARPAKENKPGITSAV